jgi:hypothetical protein
MRIIDADATIKSIKNSVYPSSMEYTMAVDIATHMIYSAPTIEPPQGEWIPSPNIMECVVCSRCNSDNLSVQVVDPPPPWYHFCPNCGAKMKGGEA